MTVAPAGSLRQPWSTTITIRFSHCDPAGIVYFASHFDLLNTVMEDTTEVLTASLVIVTTDIDRGVSVPIPDDIRTAVTAYLEGQA